MGKDARKGLEQRLWLLSALGCFRKGRKTT